MKAHLRRRYGNARKPTSQPGVPHHYGACDVLGGAYNRGQGPREDEATLCHTGVYDVEGHLLHVLCRRIPLEHLIDDADDEMREPTCPACKQRLETARAKGKALQFQKWSP